MGVTDWGAAVGVCDAWRDTEGTDCWIAGDSCFVGFSGFTLLALGMTVSRSSGEQILQPQLSGSPLSSVHSQSRWGKKSAGLLKRFLRPVGWP